MKKFIFLLLLIPSLCWGASTTLSGTGSTTLSSTGSTSFPGGVCTRIINVTGGTNYQNIRNNCGQHIKNSSSIQICKAVFNLLMEYSNASCTVKAQVWSDMAKAGTQYGGDSNTVTVSGDTATEKVFTWDSNYPNPSGDYYLHLVIVSGDDLYLQATGANYIYEDSSYNLFSEGSEDPYFDCNFDLYVMQ